MFSSEISTLLPKLQDLLLMDGMSRESIQIMVGDILNTEKLIQKNHKITKFPGVRYRNVCGISSVSIASPAIWCCISAEFATLPVQKCHPRKRHD